jgi:hypothetical protein
MGANLGDWVGLPKVRVFLGFAKMHLQDGNTYSEKFDDRSVKKDSLNYLMFDP